jgi:hypothetical protein
LNSIPVLAQPPQLATPLPFISSPTIEVPSQEAIGASLFRLHIDSKIRKKGKKEVTFTRSSAVTSDL